MAAPSRVLLAFGTPRGDEADEADRQAIASLATGFGREGLPVESGLGADELLARAAIDDLVVLSTGVGDVAAALGGLRARLGVPATPEHGVPPVIVIGDGQRRGDALAAGANAFIPKPAFVKDVVTLGRILCMPREGFEPGWGGELDSLHLYYIVRALGAAGKTGVLSLNRNGRRGELRFFEGEVTSAQVGALHGQAAFHQLLLWPDATFDLRAESVVRRQQIPLSPKEILDDAERFLRAFAELSDGISPAAIFDQDLVKSAENVDKIPREIQPLVRLFDGERTVADVIEESALRLNETLQVMGRLIALGVLVRVTEPRQPRDHSAALQVEDWVVGQSPPAAGGARVRRKSDKTPAHGAPAADWGRLGVVAAWESASYAPVVPSLSATGEIQAITDVARAAEEPKNVGTNGNKRTGTTGQVAAIAEKKDKTGPMSPAAKKRGRASSANPIVREKHFADHEQAFFDEEHHIAAQHAEPGHEAFDDLDEGKPKVGFWKRLFSRDDGHKPRKKGKTSKTMKAVKK